MNNLNSARLGRGTLLVVDKDPTEQAVFGQKLRLAGYQVVPALTAGSVLPIVSTARPDLIILDLAFPDFSGHSVLKALTLLGCPCPVVILRSVHDGNVAPPMFGTNGLRIVPEPRDSAALVQTVISTLAERFEAGPTPTHTDIAHRWAQLVIRGCTVDSDIKTVPCWASRVGVSGGSLREMCRILGIAPLCAKDLTRVLNATIRAHRYETSIESMLDVADRRTIDRLFRLSGLRLRGALPTVASLLNCQQWVPSDNAGMRVLKNVFHEPDEPLEQMLSEAAAYATQL